MDGTFHPKDAESVQAGSQARFIPDTKYRDPAFIILFALTLGGLGTKVTGRFLFFDLEVSVP
jgi:hypothetical protein